MTDHTPPSERQPERDRNQARAEHATLRLRLREIEERYARYQRELDERRQFLALATPEDDALEIAKAAAMIPVYEQTIARMRPQIRDVQQELILIERTLRDG